MAAYTVQEELDAVKALAQAVPFQGQVVMAVASDNHMHLPYGTPYPENPLKFQSDFVGDGFSKTSDKVDNQLWHRGTSANPREALPVWCHNVTSGNMLPGFYAPRRMDVVEQNFPSMMVRVLLTTLPFVPTQN